MALSAPIIGDDFECHCDVKEVVIKRKRPLTCITKTGRCGMTQKQYDCLLAIPSFRYRVRIPKKNIPNLDFTSLMWPIKNGTLNAECLPRNQDLFDLGDRPRYFAREHKVKVRHAGQGPYPGGHWAHPGALVAPIKIRLTHLAVPRKNDSLNTKKMYGKILGDKKKKLLDNYLDFYKKCIYFQEHKHKPLPPPKKSKADKYFRWPKKRGASKSGGGSRISELAKPRQIPKPKPPNRGPIMDPAQVDLDRLATPAKRYLKKPSDAEKAFKVKPGALLYNISPRINEIAQPKADKSEPPFDPWKVSEGAKHAEPSPRVVELATPNKREEPPNEDLKEEPFKVVPGALKANCTARTAELAEPVKR